MKEKRRERDISALGISEASLARERNSVAVSKEI